MFMLLKSLQHLLILADFITWRSCCEPGSQQAAAGCLHTSIRTQTQKNMQTINGQIQLGNSDDSRLPVSLSRLF